VSDRLFDNPYTDFTLVKNAVFDHVMPALSPHGWKVLCVAIRQAWGWVDDGSPTGHKESDHISPSQFMEKTGIKEREALESAIQECLEAGYLLRHQVGQDAESGQPLYAYALNTEFEMRPPEIRLAEEEEVIPALSPEGESAFQALLDFGREMEADPDPAIVQQAVTRNEADAVLAWIETGREMTHLEGPARFQTVVERLLDRVPPLLMPTLMPDQQRDAVHGGDDLPAEEPEGEPDVFRAHELWQATLGELQSQMRKSKFKWLTPTQAVELAGDTLTVAAPNERTKEWLETGQFATTIKQTLEAVAGEPMELKFVVSQ
jgi:hypothetical protein